MCCLLFSFCVVCTKSLVMLRNLKACSGGAQIPMWNVKWPARNQCNVNCFSLFDQVRRNRYYQNRNNTKRKFMLMVNYEDVDTKYWTERWEGTEESKDSGLEVNWYPGLS